MNHAVEKFIWHMGLGMKDRKLLKLSRQQKMKAPVGEWGWGWDVEREA